MLKSSQLTKVLEVCFVALKFLDFFFFLIPSEIFSSHIKLTFVFMLFSGLSWERGVQLWWPWPQTLFHWDTFLSPCLHHWALFQNQLHRVYIVSSYALAFLRILSSSALTPGHIHSNDYFIPLFLRLSCENSVTSLCAEHIEGFFG